jgi:hypothetical protein
MPSHGRTHSQTTTAGHEGSSLLRWCHELTVSMAHGVTMGDKDCDRCTIAWQSRFPNDDGAITRRYRGGQGSSL